MIDKSKLYYWGNAESCSIGSFGLLFDDLSRLDAFLKAYEENWERTGSFHVSTVVEILPEEMECFTGDDGYRYKYFYLLDTVPEIAPYDKNDIDYLLGKKWLKLKDSDDFILITELAVVNEELRINGKLAEVILSDYTWPDGGICGKRRI